MTESTRDSGLRDRGLGKGMLTFDYDGDGDLDLFIVNNGGSPRLFRNNGGNTNNWLRVQVVGTASNRDGFGTWIAVREDPDAEKQVREVGTGSHFLGQSELTAHFGLGQGNRPVDRVKIKWPTGRVQVFRDVPRNSTLVVTESEGGLVSPGIQDPPRSTIILPQNILNFGQ